MLHAGLDLSRQAARCLPARRARPSSWPSPRRRRTPTGCAGWRGGSPGQRVRGVIESMNGARFVHDTLEELGWEVLVADAQKVKGLAPLACKTDRIDARVLAVLSQRDLVPAIWLPDPAIRRERELARFRLAPGPPPHDAQEPHPRDADHVRASVPGLRPVRARRPRAARPPRRSPSRGASNVDASLALIDDLELQIARLNRRAPAPGRRSPLHPAAGHRARVRLGQRLHGRLRDRRHRTLPVAGEAVRLHRPVPARDPVRRQRSSRPDLKARPALSALGRCSRPRCTPARTPLYAERYQRTKRRLGRQRGPKVAQIDLSRKLTEAIWHMLTRNQPFAPAGARFRLAA